MEFMIGSTFLIILIQLNIMFWIWAISRFMVKQSPLKSKKNVSKNKFKYLLYGIQEFFYAALLLLLKLLWRYLHVQFLIRLLVTPIPQG